MLFSLACRMLLLFVNGGCLLRFVHCRCRSLLNFVVVWCLMMFVVALCFFVVCGVGGLMQFVAFVVGWLPLVVCNCLLRLLVCCVLVVCFVCCCCLSLVVVFECGSTILSLDIIAFWRYSLFVVVCLLAVVVACCVLRVGCCLSFFCWLLCVACRRDSLSWLSVVVCYRL